jgi:hypothetical protein
VIPDATLTSRLHFSLTRPCLFIAQWCDLGDGAVMKLHAHYESVVPMLARFVKATDT